MAYDSETGEWTPDYEGGLEDAGVGGDQSSSGDPNAYSGSDYQQPDFSSTTTAGSPSWLNSFMQNLGGSKGILSSLSPVLGGAAAARNQQENTQIQQLVQQAMLNQSGPRNRLSTGVRASLAANAQPVTNDYKPGTGQAVHFSGGMTPAALSPEARQLAQDVMHQTIQQQLQGDNIPQIGDTSTLDKILGIGSAAAGIGGALTARAGGDPGGRPTADYTKSTTGDIGKYASLAGTGAKLAGMGSAAAPILSAVALPLSLASLGNAAGWWGPNAYDSNVVHPVAGGYEANGLSPEDAMKGVASTDTYRQDLNDPENKNSGFSDDPTQGY